MRNFILLLKFFHFLEPFNDGHDAFSVMSSAYYDRTCLWSADIFTSVCQEFFLVSLILKSLTGHFNGNCDKLS